MRRAIVIWAMLIAGCGSEQQIHSHKSISPYPQYGDTDGPHDTLWYIYDDAKPYETYSSPEHVVEFHGDPSLYWYEPSGAHGLVASTDPDDDFLTLTRYIRDNAGEPIFIDAPLNFASTSELQTFEYATFTYVLCEFWVNTGDDPSLYMISAASVDDGMLVLLNGEYVGHLTLMDGGSWTLDVIPGQTNTIALILVDDSAVERSFDEIVLSRAGLIIN